MEAMVTGFERMHGKAKNGGAAYDMGRVHVLNGLSPIDRPETKRECGGFKTADLPLTAAGVEAFKKLNGVDYPVRMRLTIENVIQFDGKKESLVGVVTDAVVLRPAAPK